MATCDRLGDVMELNLLGELEVLRGEERISLPPSKKARALLAYLAATGRGHRREQLCSMFWENPNDPRGELRSTLSRLRTIVNEPGSCRIVASRESVAFEAAGAEVDLIRVRRAASHGLNKLATENLGALSTSFRGEFLIGLDLPNQHEFQAWCIAEREDLRRLQLAILTTLANRLTDPQASAKVVRQIVQIDPYNEPARIDLLRLLLASGRRQEAESHFEVAERLLREVDDDAPLRLKRAWRDLTRHREPSSPGPSLAAVSASLIQAKDVHARAYVAPGFPERGKLVARAGEFQTLSQTLEVALRERRARVTTVLGEPGIGKSRLVAELAADAAIRGGRVFFGRCYDVQLGSAYTPWTEALGTLPSAGASTSRARGRDMLFAAITAHILRCDEFPFIILEDVHWADEASAELLHHIVRAARNAPLAVVLTAREGELPDNLPVSAVLRSLRREVEVKEIRLAPLPTDGIAALVGEEPDSAGARRIARLSGGNPLYAMELARTLAEHPEGVPLPLRELVQGRVERLPAAAAELLRWASVLGPSVNLDHLRLVAPLELGELMAALEQLERHRMLTPIEAGDAAGSYLFSHELVRRAIYTSLSEPRRRLMHHKVAHALAHVPGGEEMLAGEIAHHAAAAGDHHVAATACVTAGRKLLRVFANTEALAVVGRGLRYAEKVDEPGRTERAIELTEIEIDASRPADLPAFIARVETLAGRALDHDRPDHARRCYTMLASLRWQEGAWSDAERATLRAEMIGRSAEGAERVVALGEAARCLGMLERDLPLAEALLLEALAVGERTGLEPNAVADASGLLHTYRGAYDEAAKLFQRARMLARREGNRLHEFWALEHLAMLELARGRRDAMPELCTELVVLARKLREGSELPLSLALHALCRMRRGERAAEREFEEAVGALRLADTKHRLAIVTAEAGWNYLSCGDLSRALPLAEEALAAATALGRASDIATARALLAQIAAAAGETSRCKAQLACLKEMVGWPLAASARQVMQEAFASGKED